MRCKTTSKETGDKLPKTTNSNTDFQRKDFGQNTRPGRYFLMPLGRKFLKGHGDFDIDVLEKVYKDLFHSPLHRVPVTFLLCFLEEASCIKSPPLFGFFLENIISGSSLPASNIRSFLAG